MWPVPDISVADRRYFREFTSGRPTSPVIVEPAMSKVTGNWTTIFARKITGRNGEIIGFASRGVEPSHFEDFVASLALSGDTVISMIHRDGTIIARYPQDAGVIGRNIINLPVFQKVISFGGNTSGRFVGASGEENVGAVRSLSHFPILILATTKTSSALEDWRAQTKLQFCAAVLAVLIISFAVFLIVRQLQRQHDAASRRLSEKSQHLDTAINTMAFRKRREALRSILNGSTCIRPGSVYDATSIRIAEDLGFELGMARSNVSNSIKELLSWGLIRRVPILGDRRDHFEAETDIWEVAAKIAAGRKEREIDPALAALRACVSDAAGDPAISPLASKRLKEMLTFTELVDRWYTQMLNVPRPRLVALIKLGEKIVSFLPTGRVK